MPCYDCRTVSLMKEAYDRSYAEADEMRLLDGPDHEMICATIAKSILADAESEVCDPHVMTSNAMGLVLQDVPASLAVAA